MADFSLNVKINGVEQAVTTVGQIEKALIATREELKNVAIGSEAFAKLSGQAQTLQREFVNSYKETTNFNKGIAELGQSVGNLASSVTAGFTIATTAISMFGVEGKDATEAQAKAQQALALALSATTIATNAKTIAEDINNAGLALQNGLTKLITLSLGANTVATAAQAATTGTATVAQRALNAAMAANPIGLVIAAVAALVGALFLLGGEEKKTFTYTRDLNEELDNNSKAMKNTLAASKELTTQQGKLSEAQAKTEAGKLEARIATQKAIDELNIKEVQSDISTTESKIKNTSRLMTTGAGFVETMIAQTKDLQDFNLDSKLTSEQREYAQLIRSRDLGFITEKQYTDSVVEVYKRYFSTQDADRKADFDKQVKTYDALKIERNKLNNDLIVANAEQTNNDKLAEIQRQQQREEDNKKYRDNLKKRKEELASYNKDVENLEKDRVKREQDLQRKLQDFELDRISLVKGADGVYREDLIAGYTETIEKIKVERDRSVEDEKKSFEDSLKSFKETESKRVDDKGKRIVADATINAEILKRQEEFGKEQVLRAETFAKQITDVEAEKAGAILQITDVLNNEVMFGDNNMNDSKKQLLLDDLNFQIQIKQRELELNKQSTVDKIKDLIDGGDRRIQSEVSIIRQIQTLQAAQRTAEKAATLQKLNIEKEETLKNVQGTETQKQEQRLAIVEMYKKKEQDINTDYALKEKEATAKTLKEIADQRNANLQKYVDYAAGVANLVVGLFSAINDLNKVNMENEMMAMRDSTANQTSALNEQYNQQRSDFDEKLKSGVLSQTQYNDAIKGLNTKLDADTKALNIKQKNEELAMKKKAFEEDKKLKIAQAIISGLQGAVQAFTGAFVLGPIAGPIVGGILAALVAVTTGVQVAAIKKTQFDGGAPEITSPNTSGAGSAATDAVSQAASSSSGGFTGFNQGLLGSPGAGATGTPLNPVADQRVYILESDITTTQRRVSTLESNASFG